MLIGIHNLQDLLQQGLDNESRGPSFIYLKFTFSTVLNVHLHDHKVT